MLGAGNIRDLWMPATCLILLTASIIYALVDLSNQVTHCAGLSRQKLSWLMLLDAHTCLRPAVGS